MKHIPSRWLVLIIMLLAVALSAAGPTLLIVDNKPFEVGPTRGDRDPLKIDIAQAGCILARVYPWPPSTQGSTAVKLALILNGSDIKGYYARSDGDTADTLPLWTSYAVSPSQVTEVEEWTLSIVNFTEGGEAQGTIRLEFPPTQVPCELKATVPQTRGQIDLSWRYTGNPFKGFFLIERSTDNRTWSLIRACTQAPSRSTSYACSDTGTSGTRYYYRVCAVTSGSRCGTTNLTPPVSVRAP